MPIVGFQNPRTPVSFSDPGLIEHYFKTTNKSYVISTAIKSFERYKSFYTDDEISFFFQEMALFIQNNNLGKFSLGNGRWVNIFDMLLQDGPWSAIIESLLNKIDFHELDSAKIENFWNDDITQFSLVMGRYPNLATEVYENHNVKLSMMLQESIALDMADIYRRMYRFGTKKAHGWTKDHAVFAELRSEDIPEGTAAELKGNIGYLELILGTMAGGPTWDWFKHRLILYRHTRYDSRDFE